MKQIVREYNHTEVAKHISNGFIGGFAHGRAEVGPRALGNRSIICNARSVVPKERINGYIKKRGAFQPLAPICLEDDFNSFFNKLDCNVSLDYMLYAVKCKPKTKEIFPAIVHADNTARVQLITHSNYPFLYDLLKAYKEISGYGILINTSFNGKNEPIVNTCKEAYQAYKNLDLDFLVLDKYFMSNKIL